MGQPIAVIEKYAIRGKVVTNWHMAMGEDEKIDVGGEKKITSKHDLMLPLVLELELAFVMGFTTTLGTEACD